MIGTRGRRARDGIGGGWHIGCTTLHHVSHSGATAGNPPGRGAQSRVAHPVVCAAPTAAPIVRATRSSPAARRMGISRSQSGLAPRRRVPPAHCRIVRRRRSVPVPLRVVPWRRRQGRSAGRERASKAAQRFDTAVPPSRRRVPEKPRRSGRRERQRGTGASPRYVGHARLGRDLRRPRRVQCARARPHRQPRRLHRDHSGEIARTRLRNGQESTIGTNQSA